MMNWLKFSTPLCYHMEEIEQIWSEAQEEGGRRERCFKIKFLFSQDPTLIWLIIIKVIFPRCVCFAIDGNWWVISPHCYLNPWAFVKFSVPCPAEEGSARVVLVASVQPGSTHHSPAWSDTFHLHLLKPNLFFHPIFPACQDWFEFSCYLSSLLPLLAPHHQVTWWSVFHSLSHWWAAGQKSGLQQTYAELFSEPPTENSLGAFINQFCANPITASLRLHVHRRD